MKPDLLVGEAIIEDLLDWLGLDTFHPDLENTPKRIAKMYLELFKGLYEKGPGITVFENNERYQDMIIIKDIPFKSMCSHHFMPFFGKVHFGYIPCSFYIGLSKVARVVNYFSNRPQVQERLTTQIADYLDEELEAQGLIVIVEANHTCMTLRGVKAGGSLTTTSAIRGDIDKEEFIKLL